MFIFHEKVLDEKLTFNLPIKKQLFFLMQRIIFKKEETSRSRIIITNKFTVSVKIQPCDDGVRRGENE